MSVGMVKPGAIGQPFSRVDGRLKTTGAATFTAEYRIANVAHAALVFSRVARGRVTAIETRQAENAPGILAVMTHENAPQMQPTPVFGSASDDSDGPGAAVINHSISEHGRSLFLRSTSRGRRRRNA